MANLYAHQQRAVDFILNQNGCAAIFADIGTGKTLIALTAFQRLREKTPGLKLLVICPISLIESAWGEDIKKFTSFSYCNLRKEFNSKADIFLLNYEAVITRSGLEKIQKVSENKTMIVNDESSKIKNHQAKVSKVLLKIKNLFLYRLVMSGSPAPNDETEYWTQITFVKDGIFHPSFYAFRNTYFYLSRGNQIISGKVFNKDIARRLFSQGFKYKLSPSGVKSLAGRMAPVCFKARKEDCLDLPDQVDEIRSVEMEKNQSDCYARMKNHLVVELQNQQITAPVALTKLMKLRQI